MVWCGVDTHSHVLHVRMSSVRWCYVLVIGARGTGVPLWCETFTLRRGDGDICMLRCYLPEWGVVGQVRTVGSRGSHGDDYTWQFFSVVYFGVFWCCVVWSASHTLKGRCAVLLFGGVSFGGVFLSRVFGGVVRGPRYGWMCAYGCMGAYAYAFTCA